MIGVVDFLRGRRTKPSSAPLKPVVPREDSEPKDILDNLPDDIADIIYNPTAYPTTTNVITDPVTRDFFEAADEQIAAEIERDQDLTTSYGSLVKIAEIQMRGAYVDHDLTRLSVCIQIAKYTAKTALELSEGYDKKLNIDPSLLKLIDQAIDLYKATLVIRSKITELWLTEDTYLYLDVAAERLGCQMLDRYAMLKKNSQQFRDDGNAPRVKLVQDSNLMDWYLLAVMLTDKTEFTELSEIDRATEVNKPNGDFHMLLFKLMDPDYKEHLGRKITRCIDKVFGTVLTKPCTSALCNLSPEAMEAVKYKCTCVSSMYQRKMAWRNAWLSMPAYSFTSLEVQQSHSC
ncbi:hypothetical protein ABW21_db0208285 [Orbilia brochopaga]|nr:hypothetical protein ABW21_db0208285 [Drechslerella brochopaga]